MDILSKNASINTISLSPSCKAISLRVAEKLPELSEKIKIFDRNNSQSSISMMTLTMLNGQSPMRLLRQILAEVERRKMALAEAQVSHAKAIKEIEEMSSRSLDPVEEAELRLKIICLESMESKINGSLKDIATLADAYDSIREKNKITEWDELSFEKEEKLHHVRRGFELLYRNIIQMGRPHESTIEYLQQYGVHIQVALAEVIEYTNSVNESIKNGQKVTASNMEDFFDSMASKYRECADEASVRLFGKSELANSDYMMRGIEE